uniref:Carboxylic ester hydrolase n=1 Tax=Mola mola TaxID=94237 RepID=A0A3Q3W408_MOLML
KNKPICTIGSCMRLVVCLSYSCRNCWTAALPRSINPVVSLKYGKIRGENMKVKGNERMVKQYLAIPFAHPPVGGERDGRHQPPIVSQIMSVQYTPPEVSEDCLYLNVYTPSEATATDKLPVMVWIHGGGLTMGAASQFDGAPLAAYEHIVIVIIQYRLGILGFLSTGDDHAQGNWGLLDQLAALRWVQENIEAFGGDPQAVTIAGESAGGISASILTLSPQAKGLFQRAIFQSGVGTVGAYTTNHPLGYAKNFKCQSLLYPHDGDLLILFTGESLLSSLLFKMTIFLGAVVDGEFLIDTAEELLKRQEVLKVPVLMGITNHEFGWILLKTALPQMVQPSFLFQAFSTNGLITDEYLKNAKTPEEIRDAFTEVIGDILMTFPVIKVARYHSDLRNASVPVYLYEFVYRAEIHRHTRPSFVKADHADEVGFMFGECFWNGHIKIIGRLYVIHNTKFAFINVYYQILIHTIQYNINCVPRISPNRPDLVSWPQYDKQRQEYMELGLTQTVRQKLKEDRVHFATIVLAQKLEQFKEAESTAKHGN